MSTDLDIHPSRLVIPTIIDHPTCTTAAAGVIDHCSVEPTKPTLNPTQGRKTKQPMKEITNTNTNATSTNTTNINKAAANIEDEEEDDPFTPTSDEFKIPAPKSPPPAPRKRRCSAAVACRKKLDFIDHVNHPQLIIPQEEVIQEFFKASFDQLHSRRLLKRRCPCI